MQQDERIPWFDFAVWIRNGRHAADIINIFMINTGYIRNRPILNEEQISFLMEAQDQLSRRGYTCPGITVAVNNVIYRKSSRGLNEIEIQNLWKELMDYGTNSELYCKVENKLKDTFNYNGTTSGENSNINQDRMKFILDVVWRSLGPAIAPNFNMLQP